MGKNADVKELMKKAKSGDAEAQAELASRYYFGEDGLKEDTKKAHKWAEKAAAQHDLLGLCVLGWLFNDLGTASSLNIAFKLFTEAAERGYIPAMWALVDCYLNGEGCEKSLLDAVIWTKKLAETEDKKAQYKMGEYYERGVGVPQNLDEAKTWYRLAASHGHEDAIKKLSLIP